jgi:hypothetical protein
MTAIKAVNLAIRFLLELCVLVALGYWGFQTGQSTLTRVGLGLGAPLVAAIVWGTFISPRAAIPVSLPARLLLELIVFGAAVVALAAAGQRTLAWVLALVVVINEVLLYAWEQ